jgi:release factor glutamine methyltransferase
MLKEGVFPPSINGCFVAQNIIVNQNETVVDVGTGTGIIAILSAKLGGIVFGTDINDESIELATSNAIKNNVFGEFKKSEYLNCFKQKFDVIVANLPQDIVPKNYEKAIGKELFQTISGGKTGNFHIINFLNIVSKNMHFNSRLYLPVYTDVCYKPILKKIYNNFDYRIIASKNYETREFVKDNKSHFKKLNKKNEIKIFLKNGKWFAREYLFELKLKEINN